MQELKNYVAKKTGFGSDGELSDESGGRRRLHDLRLVMDDNVKLRMRKLLH